MEQAKSVRSEETALRIDSAEWFKTMLRSSRESWASGVVSQIHQVVFLRGRCKRYDAKIVLCDGSRLIGEDVSATEKRQASRRNVSELVDDSCVSHVDVVLRGLEAVQVVFHEEGLEEQSTMGTDHIAHAISTQT